MSTPSGLGKCSKIRHIVRLRQMLRRWRAKAHISSSSSSTRAPDNVPSGHVVVRVGSECRRFVVRATHLNHPIFRGLLSQAEEEFGFDVQGPLTIPCDEALFEDVIGFISRSESAGSGPARHVNLDDFQRQYYCHVGMRSSWGGEGRPLLHGLADKTVW